MAESSFSMFGLSPSIERALAGANFNKPTPIQSQAIPQILLGRDVLGIAQTGTGKTAAFGLPLLHRLADKHSPAGSGNTRALILAPTRELAIQIHDNLRFYGKFLQLRHAVVVGGASQASQVGNLRRGVDVLVATPGRLLDLIKQKHLKLNAATTLVIDEADRMFDMGFIRDVRRIVSLLPKRRQSMLFSATMPAEVKRFVDEILNNPVRIEVSPQTIIADKIDHNVHFVAAQDKRALLVKILNNTEMKRVIVFTRTKRGADKVAETLTKSGFAADAIHGNKSQMARQRALKNFGAGSARILVATDLAARGIDVKGITHVVNFELPDVPESYVHRVGRTARAGNGGAAIAFCAPDEQDKLRLIERLMKQSLIVAGGERATDAMLGKRCNQAKNRKNNHKKRHFQRDTKRAA